MCRAVIATAMTRLVSRNAENSTRLHKSKDSSCHTPPLCVIISKVMRFPTPKPKETEREFVSRFMDDESAKQEYDHDEQRASVAFRIYREYKNKPKKR